MATEKCFTRRILEAFALDFPKDADKFLDILESFDQDGGTFGQLVDELGEAFPEKRDRILSLPIYSEFDGGFILQSL